MAPLKLEYSINTADDLNVADGILSVVFSLMFLSTTKNKFKINKILKNK